MDNLEELESNPIFLCMRLKPGQKLEFPIKLLKQWNLRNNPLFGILKKIKDEYDEHGGYDD